MDSSYGVTTIRNGQDVHEYFSLKMAAMAGKDNNKTKGGKATEPEGNGKTKSGKAKEGNGETTNDRDGERTAKERIGKNGKIKGGKHKEERTGKTTNGKDGDKTVVGKDRKSKKGGKQTGEGSERTVKESIDGTT